MTAAVIACGALAGHISDIASRRNLELHIEAIDPLLHNKPKNIPSAVQLSIDEMKSKFDLIAVAYADCGTYGELDIVCQRNQVERLTGLHCYDVFAGSERMKREFEKEAGTYVLTDFLVRTFKQSVVAELGLDRHPELRDDYFHSYKRVLWLTQVQTPELTAMARDAAAIMRLPLEVVFVGDVHLEEQLLKLLGVHQ